MDDRLTALNRFGLGARIGERDVIDAPRGWLHDQLQGPAPAAPEVVTLAEVSALLGDFQTAQRARDQERLAELRGELRELQTRESAAALDLRLRTNRPFVERLVAFWSNHLCVSTVAKRQVAALAGHYERTVVRPHVLGSFTDMVLASARHPAMLFYLDNFLSIGPGSPAGRRTAIRGRARGLNENYARELLELHTLGVDGGYEQRDVEALARILTGWSVAGVGPGGRPGETLGFVFRPATHEPGVKTLLGERYSQGGEREGERAVRALCAHPAAARFVASKLVTHFVADDPPPAAISAIEGVFLDTGGDLRKVATALVELGEAWLPGSRKLRTPQDWLTALLRGVGADRAPPRVVPLLRQLRHPLWAPPAPKGYGDTAREWADPDSLMNRAEAARSLAGPIARTGLDPARLLEVVDVEPGDPLATMLADGTIPAPERIALALAGPAFQWR